jgi:hypothetical protein
VLRDRSALGPLAVALVVAGCGGEDGDDQPRDSAAGGQGRPPADVVRCPERGDPAKAFDARRLIGEPLERARRIASRYDCELRVVAVRGEAHLDITGDYIPSRVNVVVDDRRVVRVRGVF